MHFFMHVKKLDLRSSFYRMLFVMSTRNSKQVKIEKALTMAYLLSGSRLEKISLFISGCYNFERAANLSLDTFVRGHI